MAKQYLAEGLKGAFPFIADVKNIVTESLPDGRTRTRIPGRFSVCDCVNGNGRRYGKPVWEKNLTAGSALMQAIGRNAAFGLMEHPKDGQVDLRSPISHVVTNARLQEGREANTGRAVWEVVGEIQIIDAPGFPDGQRLRSLIETVGYNPLVSSRGFGSLVRASDGIDDVQTDYVCEGWDVVIKPSFETAELTPNRESLANEAAIEPAASPSTAKITETITPPVVAQPAVKPTLEAERGSQPATPAAPAPVKSAQESSPTNTMNQNELKTQIATFRSLDPSKLGPQRFAEGMSQLGNLHQEVANFVAEDGKRSWLGQQLHDEIKAVENTWSETQLAPGKKATKLTEDNTKLMQVIKAVAKTGLVFKNKLGEALKQGGRQAALLSEVVERGQGWRTLAKQNEDAAAKYRRRFMLASEALQALGAKYKADITEMGKRVITLEFNEKANTPEIQKMLKECSKPKDLLAVRSVLEGKTSPGGSTEGTPAGKVNETKTGQAKAPVTESNKPAAKADGSPKAPVSEGVTILSSQPTDPRGLSESIGMVQRLSRAL